MKILHVWSCAGVSSLIARYMDSRHGTESDVVITEKWDTLGLNDYRTIKMKSKPLFGLKSLIMARKYDLIHVHYHSIFIPCLKFLYDKPVIIHFHGSDVRENWGARLGRIKRADAIFVSTKDLLLGAPLKAVWIPNPVDTVKFKEYPRDHGDVALTFSYGADEEALKIANNLGLRLLVQKEKIPYDELPDFMLKFDYYIDVKRDFKGRLLPVIGKPVLSKTGLEALSLGLNVIAKDMEIRSGLPEYHRPENVVDVLHRIYREFLEG